MQLLGPCIFILHDKSQLHVHNIIVKLYENLENVFAVQVSPTKWWPISRRTDRQTVLMNPIDLWPRHFVCWERCCIYVKKRDRFLLFVFVFFSYWSYHKIVNFFNCYIIIFFNQESVNIEQVILCKVLNTEYEVGK